MNTVNIICCIEFAVLLSQLPYINVFISRLCMLLILIGFLWIHYGCVELEIAEFPVAATVNESVDKGLYSDTLLSANKSRKSGINKMNLQESERNLTESSPQCKKTFDVSFLKVHKAGSTTLMNIFIRFAIEHKLNLVLPHKSTGFGFNYLGYGETVRESHIVPLPANEKYNILCNHVVYDKKAFHSIMPPDTVYVGIIREPISHFSSAAAYYGFFKHLVDISSLEVSPEKVVSQFLKNPKQTKIQTYFVYNRMCFDFGIPKTKFHNDNFIDSYIKELDKDYALVMLMEFFDESLVILRRTLCWETKDILYVPLNIMKSKPEFILDDSDIKNLKKWNSADFKLYDHFHGVFSAKMKSQGHDLEEEVESFKSIQEEVRMFCNTALWNEADMISVLTIPQNKWGNNFTVTVNDCQLMVESELPMMNRLIETAWMRYNKSMQ